MRSIGDLKDLAKPRSSNHATLLYTSFASARYTNIGKYDGFIASLIHKLQRMTNSATPAIQPKQDNNTQYQ